MREITAELFRILELAVGHVTDFFELAQEGVLISPANPPCGIT